MEKIIKYIGSDGLLHILVCYAIMLSLTPIVGIWWSILITVIAALGKEAYDLYNKDDCTDDMVLHDLICDGAGVFMSFIIIGVWLLIN